MPNQFVVQSTDVTDPLTLQVLRLAITSGAVAVCHFGTPCATFSRARTTAARLSAASLSSALWA